MDKKHKNLISVVIPTYCRPKCIEELLQRINFIKTNLFSFEIHDSSPDKNTESIVRSFQRKSGLNVNYCHYNSIMPSDVKIELAIMNVATPFVFLMGDGRYQDFDVLSDYLIKSDFDTFDFINLQNINVKNKFYKVSDIKINQILVEQNQTDFIKKNFVNMTLWGGSIVRTKCFKDSVSLGFVDKYRKKAKAPDWIYAFALTDYFHLQERDIKLAVMFTNTLKNSISKKYYPSWVKGDIWANLVFREFNNSIDLMPSAFDGIKRDIVKAHHDTFLVSTRLLLVLRSIGQLNFSFINSYKKDIVKYDNVILKLYVVCLLPKSILKFAMKIKRLINKSEL